MLFKLILSCTFWIEQGSNCFYFTPTFAFWFSAFIRCYVFASALWNLFDCYECVCFSYLFMYVLHNHVTVKCKFVFFSSQKSTNIDQIGHTYDSDQFILFNYYILTLFLFYFMGQLMKSVSHYHHSSKNV